MEDFGKRCSRFKTVMTKYGRQRRCAEFSGGDDFGEFGDGDKSAIAGPLIGGGITQVATLAAKLLGRGKPWGDKWGAAIGLGVGGAVSGILAFRQSSRPMGISALITTALVALPRLAEDMLAPAPGATKGAFGVTTAEQELQGFGDEMGADAIQLLDAGGGVGFGVTTAEQELGAGDDSPVQMLGARPEAELFGAGAGFGSNFLSAQ